jgi:hypothetical protein
VEAKALTIAKPFTIEGDCELPLPPKKMLMMDYLPCCQKRTQLWIRLFYNILKIVCQSL